MMRVAFDPNLRLADVMLGYAEVPQQINVGIKGIALDARLIHEGGMFIALNGVNQHGLEFMDDAINCGASALVYETEGSAPYQEQIDRLILDDYPVVAIDDLRDKVSTMAGRVYGHPSRFCQLIGVTGTDGKTSVVNYIAQMLCHVGNKVASVGTLGAGMYPYLHDTGHTTPDAVSMQRLLRDFVDMGATKAVMEVSSHALVQGRVADLAYDVAVFTNLSHDHLDYHGSQEAYREAKWRLFQMPGLRRAVVNLDDPAGRLLAKDIERTDVELVTYSRLGHKDADYQARDVKPSVDGIQFTLRSPKGERAVSLPLVGLFNLDNALASVAAISGEVTKIDELVECLSVLEPVKGRMELFRCPNKPTVVIDYAHTPNALETALKAVRLHATSQVLCVFGCGGDRDAAKRPLMGKVAELLADIIWVTDDNPRGESPQRIVSDILSGMENPAQAQVEHDRARAIQAAVLHAGPSDWVLVAGKGHETTQTYGAEVRRFSDHQAVVSALEDMR